jgi:putative hydrolase of the HAD superfamily
VPAVKVVSFDVFRTLIDIDEDQDRPGAYRELARWFGYHGIVFTGDDLQQRLRARVAERLQSAGEDHPDVEMLSVLAVTIEELAPGSGAIAAPILPEAAWILRTATTVSLTVVPNALETVRALGGNMRLGICSNTQRAYTIGELRMFDLLEPFEHIVFSSDVRVCKPNPKIFEAFLEKFGVTAGEVVHIGDDYQDDAVGAAAAGIRSIWIDRNSVTTPRDIAHRHDMQRVTSIEAVPEIIAAMQRD